MTTRNTLRSAQSPVGTTPGYMPGFGNDFETEALPGALPQGMNSPQKCSYGLYGEQLSGTAFTAPSHQNERTWCYRIRPSVKHTGRFARIALPYWKTAPCVDPDVISLGQYRWDPVPHSDAALTWLTGMRTMTTAGDVNTQVGMASHIYLVTQSMVDSYFFSADSELLVVPQEGRLRFCTELGVIDLAPQEIAILPRGLVYRVELLEGPARGFVCENYGQKFDLPGRGPIGANCMANRRDFKTPVAAFEDRSGCRDQCVGALSAGKPRLLDDTVERYFRRAPEYRKHGALAQVVDGIVAPFAVGDAAAVNLENLVEFGAIEADRCSGLLRLSAGGQGDQGRPAAGGLFVFSLDHPLLRRSCESHDCADRTRRQEHGSRAGPTPANRCRESG